MPTQSQGQVLRTVPLSQVLVREGFNPRDDVEHGELDRLTESVREHGLIQPLVVRPAEGGYELVDGERRYRACAQAAVTEVPVVVRDTDADTEGLDVALVANMSRVDLDPVEEARAMARLIDSGLTRKGVAEKLSLPQARVRERLQLLELDDDLLPQVADGRIPLAAVKPLTELAKIHPHLAARASAQVLEGEQEDDYYGEQWTWKDVQQNALEVAIADEDELPAGIYLAHRSYPLERFTLSEKAQADLEKFAKLRGVAVEEISTLRFDASEVEQARALGAAHDVGRGIGALIAGQDVADQIASDAISAALKQERTRRRELQRSGEQNGDGPAAAAGEAPPEPVDEEAAKEQRRREREQEQETRREATAYNAELGAACVKELARLRVDERVVRVLSAFDLGSQLDKIALRGARYGLPGWVLEEQRKNGTTKTVYLDRHGAHAKAREFLRSAKSAAELAGRQVVLLTMARYADERAIAHSQRAFYTLTPGDQLPFSDEVIDLVDDLAGEKLPEHVLERGREERDREATERAKKREDTAWYEQQYAALEAMSPDERQAVLVEHEERFGPYGGRRWQLEARIRELSERAQSDAGEAASDTEGADA